MRIVIKTEDNAGLPPTADHLQAQSEEQPQAAQDAGPGPAAESGPAGRTAPGAAVTDSAEPVDAGAPPEWLVDEIARLRAGEESGTLTRNTLEDAGPAGENTETENTNARAAAADSTAVGKKSS